MSDDYWFESILERWLSDRVESVEQKYRIENKIWTIDKSIFENKEKNQNITIGLNVITRGYLKGLITKNQ